MTEADYQQTLDKCGAWRALTPSERAYRIRTWREAFATRLHEKTRKWKSGDFDWHVFSFQYAPSMNGEEALTAYEAISGGRLFVVPEDSGLEAVFLRASRLPDFRPYRGDVIVWPDTLAWTMAFTHEESLGLGPYFSRREWIERNPP